MPDGIILKDQDRTKLDNIVSQMTANNESDEDIQLLVNDFKTKYGQKKNDSSLGSKSGSQSLNFGGGGDLNSLTSGNKPIAPTVLTPEGQEEFKETVVKPYIAKKEELSQRLNKANNVYKKVQGQKVFDELKTYVDNRPEDTISEPEEQSFTESVTNTGKNIGNRLEGFIPRLKVVSSDVWEKVLGKELAGKFYGLEGRDLNEERRESYVKLNQLAEETQQTQGIVGNIQNFDAPRLAAGVVDAVGSIVSTAIPAVLTGGAGLFTDMAGESIVNFNEAKAKAKGVSVDKLYETGDAEFNVPFSLGVIGGGLELIGLKGVQSAITKNLKGSALKRAGMMFSEANKEGMTEWIQTGLETANIATAEGKSGEEIAEEVAKTMLSKKGLESYVMGMVGSGTASVAGRYSKKVYDRVLRKEVQDLEKSQEATMKDIANPDLAPEIKEELIDVLVDNQSKINRAIKKDDSFHDKLNEEQKEQIQKLDEQANKLETIIADETVSNETKAQVKEKLERIQERIAEIVPDTEESLGKEFQEAEKTFKEDGDQTAFDNKMADIEARVQQLPENQIKAQEEAQTNEQVLPEQSITNEQETTQTESISNERSDQIGGNIEATAEPTIEPATEGSSLEPEGTALKNADVEVKRKEAGFEPFEEVTRKSNPKLVEDAKLKLNEGYNVPDLINNILNGKKEANDEEVVMLKLYQLAKEDEILDYNDKIVKATKEGNDFEVQTLINQRDVSLDELNNSQLASKKTGTVSARAQQARTINLLSDYSLANMLIGMRETNKGEKLSPEQYDKMVELYEAIKTKNEQLEAEKERLTKQNIDLLAEKSFKKVVSKTSFEQRKTGRVQQREAIQKDISTTLDSLKKKLKAERTKLNSGISLDMIPEIAKLAQLYAKLGINTVEGVVDKIYTNLKDEIEGLNTDDIKAVLANYDFEAQAKEEARLKNYKTRTEAKISELRERINRGDFAKRKIAPIKLDEKALELRDALMKARYEYDVELLKNELSKRSDLEKANDLLVDVSGVFRAMQATLDLSAVFNQGFIKTVGGLISRRPDQVPRMIWEMLRQTVNEKRYNRWLYDLQENPYYDVIKESGLYISDVKNPKITAREEALQSNLVNKIPLINILTRGSERAYSSFLNMQRVDSFIKTARVMEMQGKTIETHPKEFKELANYINSATGRGDLGALEGGAKFLASTMFSPRFLAARVRLLTNLINPYWWKDTPMNVKVMYFKDMTKIAAAVSAIAGLALYAGYDVEDDPRSSDFMKIRIGDTRIDLLQGFGQIIVFIARLITGQSKNKYGKVKDVSRLYTIWRFLRSKFAPIVSISTNLLDEKDYLGEEYTYKDVPSEVIPLSAREIVKNWGDEEELKRTVQFLPFTILGGRVSTYK